MVAEILTFENNVSNYETGVSNYEKMSLIMKLIYTLFQDFMKMFLISVSPLYTFVDFLYFSGDLKKLSSGELN